MSRRHHYVPQSHPRQWSHDGAGLRRVQVLFNELDDPDVLEHVLNHSVFVDDLDDGLVDVRRRRHHRPQHPTAALPDDPRRVAADGPVGQQWITLRTLVPILCDAGNDVAAAAILAGPCSHGQADSWGVDGESLRVAEATLRDHLGDRYAAACAVGKDLDRSDLIVLAERSAASMDLAAST